MVPKELPIVGDIGEKRLIEKIIEILGYWGNEIISGSDDAIGIPLPPKSGMVPIFNTDMLVSTTDVPPQMDLVQAGRKAVVMACSDLLVKGVIPSWISVSLGIPRSLEVDGNRGFEGLIHGLRVGSEILNVRYLGGDLNETLEVIIDVTAIGYIDPSRIIHRGKAKPGDLIFSTGTYGLTGAGLHMLVEKNTTLEVARESYPDSVKAVLLPDVNQAAGPGLSVEKIVNASADSSDGLLRTINEIASASQVGYILHWDSIPIASEAKNYSSDYNISNDFLVLSGGEEFTHIFCIPPEKIDEIPHTIRNQLQLIGEITSKEEGRKIAFPGGEIQDSKKYQDGYVHFTSKN